ERLLRVLQGLQVRLEDLVDDSLDGVRLREILVDELHRLHELAGERDLDLLEAARTEHLAEADDAALAGAGTLGHLRHRHVDDVAGVIPDEIGDARRRRRQVRPQHRDAIEHTVELARAQCRLPVLLLAVCRARHQATFLSIAPRPSTKSPGRTCRKRMPARMAPLPSVAGLSPIMTTSCGGRPSLSQPRRKSSGSGLPTTS